MSQPNGKAQAAFRPHIADCAEPHRYCTTRRGNRLKPLHCVGDNHLSERPSLLTQYGSSCHTVPVSFLAVLQGPLGLFRPPVSSRLKLLHFQSFLAANPKSIEARSIANSDI
jgi:hypothetical protein